MKPKTLFQRTEEPTRVPDTVREYVPILCPNKVCLTPNYYKCRINGYKNCSHYVQWVRTQEGGLER